MKLVDNVAQQQQRSFLKEKRFLNFSFYLISCDIIHVPFLVTLDQRTAVNPEKIVEMFKNPVIPLKILTLK